MKKGLMIGLLIACGGGTAATLPVGYQEVAFIQSCGVQCIDTGCKVTGTMRIEADFALIDLTTTQQRIFGTQTDRADRLTCAFYVNNSLCYAWGFKDGSGNWQSTAVPVSTAYRRFVLDGGAGTVALTDVASGQTLYSGTINTTHTKTSNHNLYLFADYESDDLLKHFGSLRLSAFSVSDGGQLLRAFVPCVRRSDAAVGLYDTVTDAFFTNAPDGSVLSFIAGPFAENAAFGVSDPSDVVLGDPLPTVSVTNRTTGATLTPGADYELTYTGTDAAGEAMLTVTGLGEYAGDVVHRTFCVYAHAMRLPSGYRELAYIRGTGVQYIDTGLHMTPRTTATLDATPLSTASQTTLLRTLPDTTANDLCCQVYFNVHGMLAFTCCDATFLNETTGLASYNYSTTGGASATGLAPAAGNRCRITVDVPQHECRVDGRHVLDLSPMTKSSVNPLLLLCSTDACSMGDIHSFTVVENGTVVGLFVPCRRMADGAVGLYDLVTESFFPNANASALFDFGGGPAVFNYSLDVADIPSQGWDGATAVVPMLTVTDRLTGAPLVEGTHYAVAFTDNNAVGTATATLTGLGDYAGSTVEKTFRIHRAGGAFAVAVWSVDAFNKGPTADGVIPWDAVLPSRMAKYQTFLAGLDADWMGVNGFVERPTPSSQLSARNAFFLDFPAWTAAQLKGTQWNPSFRSDRIEVLSSSLVALPQTTRSGYALEERVRIDDAIEAVFVNAELDTAKTVRDAQIAFLASRYVSEPRVVLCGDFHTEQTLVDGTTRHTDWDAFTPLTAAGYVLANASEGTNPCRPKNAAATAATTQIAVKGFGVSQARVVAPYQPADDAYGLSDNAAMTCTLTPLAATQVARPANPVPQLYDGAAKTPVVTANDAYTVTGGSWTHAGTYDVTVALKDKAATCWDDGTTGDLTLSFTIEKNVNDWTTSPSISPTTWTRRSANVSLNVGVPAFGTVVCSHTQAQLNALTRGTHAVTFTVAETDDYAGLAKTIEVSVEEPFVVTLSADGATADLQFNYSTRTRKLYAVYGFEDAGGATSKWTKVVSLGDIAPGVTSVSEVAIPEDLGYDKPNLRFLVESAFDSTDYVQDGLLAQWDAIENAGRGAHDESASSWTELVNGLSSTWFSVANKARTVDGSTPAFGARGVTFDGSHAFDATVPGVKEALNAKAFTIQTMIRPTAGMWQWYQGVFQIGPGGSNRELILDTRQQSEAPYVNKGKYTFCGLQYRRSGWSGLSVITPENYLFNTNVLVTVTTDASGAHLWFDDAVDAPFFTTPDGGTSSTSDLFTFGWYIGNLAYPMTAYGIRLYDCTLTADEIAWNSAVDHERYTGVMVEKSPIVTVARPILSTLHGGATADVRFNASARPQKLYFVWGRKDGGSASTNAWDGAALVADVPPGTSSFTGLALPAGAKQGRWGRFLLAYDEYLTTDYDTDGLLLQLDAIENAGVGVHKSVLTNWTDLVTGKELAPYGVDSTKKLATTPGKPVYNDAGVKLVETYYQTEVKGAKEAINAKSITVQMFMNPDSYTRYQGIFQFGTGGGNREIILDDRRENGQSGDYSFAGLQYRETGWQGRSVVTVANDYFGKDVLATVTTDNAGAHLWFDDAATCAFTTVGGNATATSDLFTLAGYVGNYTYPMTLYAVRIYNRTLTAQEIARNCTLDRARFVGGEPPYAAGDLLAIRSATVVIIR